MVISPDHHSRHLESEEEKAQFARTAPIETAAYWDLADEVHRQDADPAKIKISREAMENEIAKRAMPERDQAVLAASRLTMDRTIELEVDSRNN